LPLPFHCGWVCGGVSVGDVPSKPAVRRKEEGNFALDLL
jgi:hypothetical protein